MARLIHLDTGEQPIIMADYGSSEGKNSLAPMRAAIAMLRARAGSERPIFVYHTDLQANEFNTLSRPHGADVQLPSWPSFG